MVNGDNDSSSVSSRASEEVGDLLRGDLYVSNFGDCVCMKTGNTLRIGFQNIGGFSTKGGKLKEDNIRQGLLKWDFDIFGMAETNLDWRMLNYRTNCPQGQRNGGINNMLVVHIIAMLPLLKHDNMAVLPFFL
jgi:hypothetical protein